MIRYLSELKELIYHLDHAITGFSFTGQCDGNLEELYVEKILRFVRGRRVVLKGLWRNRQVIVKIFFPPRAHKHAKREKQGFQYVRKTSVLTPLLLAEGSAFQSQIQWLIFEFIPSTVDCEAIWNSGDELLLKSMLIKMQTVVLQLHQHGLVHHDMHPNNFILNDAGLYLIDVAAVELSNKKWSVAVKKSIKNIVSLYVQMAVYWEKIIRDLFEVYCHGRHWNMSLSLSRQIQRELFLARDRRIKNTLKRSFRNCKGIVYFHSWTRRYACREEYAHTLQETFFQHPEAWIQGSRIIKNGNSCTVFQSDKMAIPVIIKRYNVKNGWHGLKKCWYSSRAARSWQNAQVLSVLGIKTARPIAFFEKRFLKIFHGTSYFLCEFQRGELLKHDLMRENSSASQELLYIRLKMLFQSFWNARIVHGDLKYTNFIISNREPVIIDLDSVTFYYRSKKFKKAYVQDIKRFLANWEEGSSEHNLFKSLEEEIVCKSVF